MFDGVHELIAESQRAEHRRSPQFYTCCTDSQATRCESGSFKRGGYLNPIHVKQRCVTVGV